MGLSWRFERRRCQASGSVRTDPGFWIHSWADVDISPGQMSLPFLFPSHHQDSEIVSVSGVIDLKGKIKPLSLFGHKLTWWALMVKRELRALPLLKTLAFGPKIIKTSRPTTNTPHSTSLEAPSSFALLQPVFLLKWPKAMSLFLRESSYAPGTPSQHALHSGLPFLYTWGLRVPSISLFWTGTRTMLGLWALNDHPATLSFFISNIFT